MYARTRSGELTYPLSASKICSFDALDNDAGTSDSVAQTIGFVAGTVSFKIMAMIPLSPRLTAVFPFSVNEIEILGIPIFKNLLSQR